MAIINCVVCGKRISSKSKQCTHCNANFTEEGSVQNIESATAIERMYKSRKLQSWSFVAVIVFIIGILVWLYQDVLTMLLNKNFGLELSLGGEMVSAGKYILALGFVGYITSRVFIYINKKK